MALGVCRGVSPWPPAKLGIGREYTLDPQLHIRKFLADRVDAAAGVICSPCPGRTRRFDFILQKCRFGECLSSTDTPACAGFAIVIGSAVLRVRPTKPHRQECLCYLGSLAQAVPGADNARGIRMER